MTDLLTRMRQGEAIDDCAPENAVLISMIRESLRLVQKINTTDLDDAEQRQLFQKLMGHSLHADTWIITPFYTDFGKFIKLGKGVFINQGCTLMDRGGIIIEDGALLGPKVNIITENHCEESALRRHVYGREVRIGKGVWIGAAATILPGVSIGENAIIGAGSIVTHDIPANSIAAGNPARIIRNIKENPIT